MVGERLAELRERKALTLRDLEEASGVGADAISKIENGHRKPRPSTLRKLARALGVEVEDFYREPAVPLAKAPAKAPQEPGPSDQGTEEEQLPKNVAEVRAKFLPIAAVLEDYCRAYEQLTERAELTDEDVEAFVHTAVEANDYHRQAIEVELRALGHVLGRKLAQVEQLYDLSVLRPAFARYYRLMRAIREADLLPDGEEKTALVELTSGA